MLFEVAALRQAGSGRGSGSGSWRGTHGSSKATAAARASDARKDGSTTGWGQPPKGKAGTTGEGKRQGNRASSRLQQPKTRNGCTAQLTQNSSAQREGHGETNKLKAPAGDARRSTRVEGQKVASDDGEWVTVRPKGRDRERRGEKEPQRKKRPSVQQPEQAQQGMRTHTPGRRFQAGRGGGCATSTSEVAPGGSPAIAKGPPSAGAPVAGFGRGKHVRWCAGRGPP